MNSHALLTGAVFAAGIFSIFGAQAASVELAAAKDSTLYEDPNRANGSGEYLFAGHTNQVDSQNERRILIAFDTSAIPAGSTITAVTLHLYASRSSGGSPTIGAYRVTQDWSEGASNPSGEEGGGAVAQSGDSTWIYASRSTSAWATPGGDHAAAASATTEVDIASPVWAGAGLVADVQAWLAQPESNYGWLLRSTSDSGVVRFYSSESSSNGFRPVLHVDYTPVPVPAAIWLLGSALGLLGLVRRT